MVLLQMSSEPAHTLEARTAVVHRAVEMSLTMFRLTMKFPHMSMIIAFTIGGVITPITQPIFYPLSQ